MSDTTVANYQIPALRRLSPLQALAIIGGISLAVVGFLFWLIYFKPAASYASSFVPMLPAVNAAFNSTAAVCLIAGYRAIRRQKVIAHIRWIIAALVASTLFFISYVVYHNFHGDTKFLATGIVRPIYFFILITHIVLSAIVVPMILTSLYLALAGKLPAHRRLSRWTFPVWLYVSVTGVVIFIMLKAFNP
jgi:putative membrane protein